MEHNLEIIVPRSVSERLAWAGALLGIGITTYLFSLIIYRLFFHPLRKFPGPAINRISSIPTVIWTLQGRLPMQTKKLHDKHGSIIRLSPNELSFNSTKAWNDIYGHRPGRRDLQKDPIHVGSVDPIPGVQTISMADHDNHARQRKALSHGFSKQALWSQEAIVNGFVTKLMENLQRLADSGETFDIVRWLNFVTFDVIGDLSFGESFGCLERGEFHFWTKLIFEAVKAGAIEQATRRFATPGSGMQLWLMKWWIPNELRKNRREHLQFSRDKVMKRINEKTDRKDFIHYIMKQGEVYDLKQDEIIVNAALFIVAGSETTASSLSALTNNLLRHPQVYDKLKAEIRGTFKSEDEICLEKITELPYLSACIEENLRIFPPAPIGFLRSINPGGDTIDGVFVPGGTSVSVSSWCAHHSSSNFKDPDSFIPERWLEDNKEYLDDKKLASRPFSLGPRGCIGKDLSYMEMRLVLARLIYNFDLKFANDDPKTAWEWDAKDEMKNMKAYSTWEKPQLLVTIHKGDRIRWK